MAFGISKINFIFHHGVSKLHDILFGEDYVLNINKNLNNPDQKKVLLIYITKVFKTNFSSEIRHPNLLHSIQMLSVLIQKGYTIDVFHTKGVNSLKYIQKDYDYIIGFGPVYEKAIESGVKGLPILFLTENDPRSVKGKYYERIEYYKERRNDSLYKKSKSRESFYSEKQLALSKLCRVMSSSYNLKKISELYKTYQINANGLHNIKQAFNPGNSVANRTHFVWFGSNGCIHKGLDILVEVFKTLPEYELSIYGLPQDELPIIKRQMTPNIKYCASVDVYSQRFIDEVVNKHCFAILPSCSEGMNTGIATCMRHGLIPIVSKETGFEPDECIIELEDYHIEYIREKLLSLKDLKDEELTNLSRQSYKYSNQNFSLESFTDRFSEIIDDIEANYSK